MLLWLVREILEWLTFIFPWSLVILCVVFLYTTLHAIMDNFFFYMVFSSSPFLGDALFYHESHVFDNGGPLFNLTPEVLELHQEEFIIVKQNQMDLVNCVIHFNPPPQLLCWVESRIVGWRPCCLRIVKECSFTTEGRRHEIWLLSLSDWIPDGFWVEKENARLKEWQRLPNTYLDSDVSHLDLDTDVREKRIGVFHELLHFTVQLKNECMHVSNLHKPLALPQKFANVFEWQSGMFNISRNDTQTVV